MVTLRQRDKSHYINLQVGCAATGESVVLNPFDLPEPLLKRAMDHGTYGTQWIEELPRTLAAIAAEWKLDIGRRLECGTEAILALVHMPGGREAVLKVRFPDRNATLCEVAALLAAQGRGYADLFAYSIDRQALLIERLGEPLGSLGMPVERQILCICTALQRSWTVPASDLELMSGAEKAARLSNYIGALWNELGRPCEQGLVHHAIRLAGVRAAQHNATQSVLTHGDAHPWNILRAPGAGAEEFRLIDPDGLVAEPAYDLGVQLREWTSDLLAGDPVARGWARCDLMARLTGVDPAAIWQWGYIQLIASGLHGLKFGDPEAQSRIDIARTWWKAEGSADA